MAGVSHYIPYGWIHLWWENTPEKVEAGVGFICQEECVELEE